ncbi:MAG: DJ-1 family protein [Thermoplasmata archaeon]|nr:MAG: DJ-1 family protein [Thermoplasmata archaeon]
MPSGVILLADGFEEVETLTVVDVLRRCSIETDVAGVSGDIIEGAHGIKVIPDKDIEDVEIDSYDALLLPGGNPGYKNLRSDERVIAMIKTAFAKNKIVAAICAAPLVLADAGILKGKRATIYPGMEDEIVKAGAEFSEDLVVVDGNIITSRGPATAVLFALKLGEILANKEIADRVARRMLLDLIR